MVYMSTHSPQYPTGRVASLELDAILCCIAVIVAVNIPLLRMLLLVLLLILLLLLFPSSQEHCLVVEALVKIVA
jgi:hypothetical protein